MAQDAPVLKIGTEGTYAPFSFFAPDGKLTGFDIEITQAMCDAAKLTCKFETLDFDGMIPALNQRKLDALAVGFSITEKRKKQVAFTDSYRTSDKRFVTCRPDVFKDVSPETLKSRVIGTQSGTSSADYFKSFYPESEIRLYKSMDEAFQDLGAGRLDLAMATEPVGYDFISKHGNGTCAFVGPRIKDEKFFGSGVGIAFRLDETELVDKFNAALKTIRDDGTYEAINARYFPFSIY
ncbi:MAG: transporter substrate-binding domain-containing protein [Rhizobiales bacterium]|nr:transporter substrate-binding domain-containing protein [Hyphomicrobiales bacterium]